jgi:hypothetical protein
MFRVLPGDNIRLTIEEKIEMDMIGFNGNNPFANDISEKDYMEKFFPPPTETVRRQEARLFAPLQVSNQVRRCCRIKKRVKTVGLSKATHNG